MQVPISIAPHGGADAADAWGESQRKAWLDAARGLDDGGDASAALAFWRDHEALCLASVGAVPGDDRVRVALLRALPAAVPDASERQPLIQAASSAIEAHATAEAGATHTLRRPPAWFGLCVLELWGLEGAAPPQALDAAVQATRDAFQRTLGSGQPLGDGEILWALAEQAEAAGWQATADHLLDLASAAAFDDASLRAQVRLLLCWRLCEQDDPRVDALLADLRADDQADAEVAVQARWLSALRIEAEAPADARALLDEALALVDPEADPEVAAQLRARRDGVGSA